MTNAKLYRLLDWGIYAVLLLSILAIPIFADLHLLNFYVIPKQYVLIGLTALAFILYSARVVLSKRFELRTSVVDKVVLALLGVFLVSAIFSVNAFDSFLGRSEFFSLNVLYLVFLALNFFLTINSLNTTGRWGSAANLLIAVGGLSSLVFVLRGLFRFDLLSMLGLPIWNTIDALNSQFGIWLIVTLLLSGGMLVRQNTTVGRSLYFFFVYILSFASLVLLSFNLLWWILLGALILLLLLSVSFLKEARTGWISVMFATLVLTVIFISFGTPRSLQSALPAEVSLGLRPSWTIAYHTVTSGVVRFILGSGPGTFGTDFSKFRPANFNFDPNAWSLRFNQPNNTISALLSEGGVVTLVIFLFLAAFILGHVFHVWYRKAKNFTVNWSSLNAKSNDDVGFDGLLFAVVWFVLTISMAFLFFGPVLWWLWWFSLGMTISGLALSHDHIVHAKSWTVDDTPQYSLAFSFTLIVIITGVIMVGVWGGKMYYGEYMYARALKSSDVATAQSQILSALNQRPNSDIYNAALAQIFLLQAADLARADKPDVQSVSALVASAVNAAKKATDVSPQSVAIWENLATMYENAASIVPEARDWAIKSVQQASDLEPTNPVLFWRLGNNYSLGGKWEDAQKAYEKAIALKSDYLGSYIGLANVYEQKRDVDKAVETYRAIMPYALNSSEALFNFGRLLYNRNKGTDRDDAEKLWNESVRITPNYSNALYSLGLMYESRGDRARALEYYYKVKDLNPGNKDISDKIRSMVGGTLSQ